MHAYDGAHGVEHIYEEEGEHDCQHVPAEDALPLELAEDGADAVGKRYDLGREGGDGSSGCGILDEDSDDGGGKDTPEDTSTYLRHNKAGSDEEADYAEEGLAMGDVAEADEGGVVVDDDTGILQADEGDEEADTGSYGFLESSGNGIDEP